MFCESRSRAGLFFAAVLACSVGLSHAAFAETDAEKCHSAGRDDAKAGLAACNRAIASGRLKGADLVKTYADRARLLGDSFSTIFDPDRAIADYTKAIELAAATMPDMLWSYYLDRGRLYENHKKDLARALEDYTAVIKHLPRSSLGYDYRSRVYESLKDYDRAIADMDVAINLRREDYEAAKSKNRDVSNEAFLLYAALAGRQKLYEVIGNFDGAIADLNEQMKIMRWEGPHRASYLETLARLYEAKADFAGASGAYSDLIAMNANDDKYYFPRGLAYIFSGKPDSAIADLNRLFDSIQRLPPDQKKAIWQSQVFFALFLDIATQRAGKPTRLKSLLPEFDMTQWPGPLVQMFLGTVTPASFAANSDQNTVCGNNFFAGERAMQIGAKDEAIGFFRTAVKSCTQPYRNYAVAELRMLGITP